jgi:hypothetical protein
VALDFKAGFGFGFAETLNKAPEEQDTMGHLLVDAAGGVGPGLILGPIDFLPALGVGLEGIAWGSTASDNDDATGEAFWYGSLTLAAHLTSSLDLVGNLTRAYRDEGLAHRYSDRIEGGVRFLENGRPLGLAVWYADYQTLFMAGLAVSVSGLKK